MVFCLCAWKSGKARRDLSGFNRASASGAGSSTMKRVAITNWPPFPVIAAGTVTVPGAAAFFLRCGTSRSCSGLRLHRVLVHCSGARYVAIEGGAGRYKVVLHFLVTLGTGAYLNSGRIDALLLDQVVLRVDGALCSQRVGLLLSRKPPRQPLQQWHRFVVAGSERRHRGKPSPRCRPGPGASYRDRS